MENQPLVTIITPAYNRAHFLPETIESVLSQDYDNFEYIILDDGSTDHTQTVLKNYTDPRIRWTSHANIGEVATVNKGFKQANGDYIVVLNSDDTLLPGYLRKSVEFMQKNPEVLMGYPRWAYLTADSVLIHEGLSFEYRQDKFIAEQRFVFGPGMILRRQAIELVPERNPSYRYMHEIDYAFKLCFYSKQALGRIPYLLATWRSHEDNLQKENQYALNQEKLQWVIDFFNQPNLPKHIKRLRRIALSNAYYNFGFISLMLHNKPIQARYYFLKAFLLVPFYRSYYSDGMGNMKRTYLSIRLFLPILLIRNIMRFINRVKIWFQLRISRLFFGD
ncbi:MAG: glycosyltransferase family 2 protein [Phototrophicales bacterium]